MCIENPLAAALRDKIVEQIERTEHLIGLIPLDCMDWAPPVRESWTVTELLDHLVECMLGFCAVLHAADPQGLTHLRRLRDRQQVVSCAGAIQKMEEIRPHIEQGFQVVTDFSLSRRVPTLFVREGETLLTLFLGNLEHLINHKHQLFTYLRLMGVEAGSPDLYRFRR